MVIGIDARFFGKEGPGRYIKNIISHLEKLDTLNSYKVFLRKSNFDLYTPKSSNFTKVLADYPWYSFTEQLFFPLRLIAEGLDLFYIPHFNVPILYPGKIVTAIPDIIMHTFSTEEGTTLPRPYYKFKKFVYFAVVFFAILKSKKVIVPSLATLDDMLKVYKIFSRSKFVLSYEGVDPDILSESQTEILKDESDTVLERYGISRPYLLYIGSAYKHKNLERLLSAFKMLRESYKYEGQLVIVGKKDAFSEKLARKAHEMKIAGSVKFPGLSEYIPDHITAVLRKNASLYVFPSLKEGFSLTPLEAMAFGLPCVVSDIPCHREIYGDTVAYFDPEKVKSIADAILAVLTDEKTLYRLKTDGYEKLSEFNWEETAKDTLAVFMEQKK